MRACILHPLFGISGLLLSLVACGRDSFETVNTSPGAGGPTGIAGTGGTGGGA